MESSTGMAESGGEGGYLDLRIWRVSSLGSAITSSLHANLTAHYVIKEEQGRTVAQLENETSDECCYSSIAVIMFAGIAHSLQNLSEELYQCHHCSYGFPLKMDKGKVQ